MRPEVREAMRPFFEERFGNPASIHSEGQASARAVAEARRQVRDLCGGPAGDVIFTGSGTEAVLLGTVGAVHASFRGRRVVTSAVEHVAGRDAASQLEAEGYEVIQVRPDVSGRIEAEAVLAEITQDTALVSIMHANNETGVVHPIAEIARGARDRGVPVHVDAVQSAGKIEVTAQAWGIEFLSVAAHKLGGPQGVGALWRRRDAAIVPGIPGPQEGGMRGGTLNTAGIVGMGIAARASLNDLDRAGARMLETRRALETALAARVPAARISAAEAPRLPNTVHLTFDPAVGTDLVVALDLAGFAVSAGSACRSGSEEPSPVLLALGFSPERARTAVRVSFGADTEPQELEAFAQALAAMVESRLPARIPG